MTPLKELVKPITEHTDFLPTKGTPIEIAYTTRPLTDNEMDAVCDAWWYLKEEFTEVPIKPGGIHVNPASVGREVY